ncbi:MAG: carboxymuconolactone decarboxylase family protein [Acidimicrobiales bacterium]
MSEFMPLVAPDDLPADLRAQWDATTRPGLRDFMRLMAHAPDHFRRYNEVYGQLRFDNHLGVRVTELVRIAVSQTTQCQVCMAGRLQAATAEGVTEDVVCQINAAHRPDMSPAEDAAVTFALKFANDHQSITDADKQALRDHFTPEQVVELALLCVMCLVGRFSNIVGLLEDGLPG